MGVFTKFETFLMAKLSALLSTYLAVFGSKMIILLQLGIPILILYYGYSIMTPRGSNASIDEMLFNLVRIAIIFAFVQNSAGLLDLSISFIHELKTGFIGATSIFSLLDEQFLVTQKLTVKIIKIDNSITGVTGMLASLMIWLGTIFVLASSAIVFIAAEVGLALLTVTSPIFIGCLIYGFTRELFNGWLRSIFSCVITLIFATLVVRIGIDIGNDIIKQLATAPAENSLLTIGATALVVGIVVSSLVLVSTKMAGNIAGVAALSAIQGGMILATKAGSNFAMSSTASAIKGGRNAASRYSRNRQTAQNSSSSPTDSQKAESDNTLKTESQKVSFARAQNANSQD